MPRRDGTGPFPYMTRRNRNFARTCGFRMGCGFGSRFIEDEIETGGITEKQAINIEKELLESRLKILNTQLSNLKED